MRQVQGATRPPGEPEGTRGIRVFYTAWTQGWLETFYSKKLTNARVSQLSSYLTAAKRPGCFASRAHATAVPEYRPQTTCEPAAPTATATDEPGKCVETPQDSIASTNPGWLETASGSPVLEAFELRADPRSRKSAIANDPHNSSFIDSVGRELRCPLRHARSLG